MAEDEMWEDGLPFLHVYGAFMPHSPVMIRGTREGLEALRTAIDAALSSGAANANVLDTGGEHYSADVICSALVSGLGSPEYLYDRDYEHFRAEYARASNMGMRVLSGPFASGKFPPPPASEAA